MAPMSRVSLLLSGGASLASALPAARGVGDGKAQQPKDLELLSDLSWWYSWGLNPIIDSDFSQEYVAMAWGRHQAQELKEWTPHRSTKYLLGFNEPNLHGQSDMTAKEACALWPSVVSEARRRGLSIGSPAANHCSPNDNCFQSPEDWFDEFFAQPGCDLSTVDFVATHKYGCNATDTVEYVRGLHKRYGKPIWLTEFSCLKAPAEKQLAFMKEILPQFDAMPEVIPRYAWYQARAAPGKALPGDLITEDGLNDLGKFYTSTAPKRIVV